MSVLAAVGSLPPDQLTELSNHLAHCERCNKYLETAVQSSLELMPAFWEKRKQTVSVIPPDGMRSRFLQRLKQAKAEEARPIVELDLPLEPFWLERKAASRFDSAGRSPQDSSKMPAASLLIAASAVLAAGLSLGGYYVGMKSKGGSTMPGKETVSAAAIKQAVDSAGSNNTSADNGSKDQLLRSALTDLTRAQSIAAVERRALEERLAASDARLTSLQQDNANALQRTQEAERRIREDLEESRKENESLRRKVAQMDAFLAAQAHEAQELQNELQIARNGQQAQNDQGLVKGQLGDLVTARNLHIVDVYDSDGGGQRKAAFGRVFYVEGKSLLFYAYDLQDARHAKANVVFRVWGGRAGVKEATHSLGILRNEDTTQGLWTMTFDDAKVMAQINLVFVTAESASRRDLVPHGKKVLYAYLGNPPNHP